MLILPSTTTVAFGYLLREGVVLNLPDEVADRLIRSGHAVAYVEPTAPAEVTQQAPAGSASNSPKRSKKEA